MHISWAGNRCLLAVHNLQAQMPALAKKLVLWYFPEVQKCDNISKLCLHVYVSKC
jgi:hypothetical protein